MSVSAMVETYDMPMIDYNEDGDIPMSLGGTSSENWFQPVPRMDEDVHHIGPFSDFQEVDMMAFEETTTEYEMTDEAAQPQDADIDTHVFDAEVYDVTIHPSPAPHGAGEIDQSHLVQTENLGNSPGINGQPHFGDASHLALSISNAPVVQHLLPSDTTQGPDTSPAAGDALAARDSSASEVFGTSFEHRAEPAATEGQPSVVVQPAVEVTNRSDDHSSVQSENVAASVPSDNTAGEATGEADNNLSASHNDGISFHENEAELSSERDGDEETSHALQTAEESAGIADENTPEQSEPNTVHQVYIPPPPSIFLSLQVASAEGDQPEFVLFNYPESSSHTTEEPLLLLQHHPSLFYEPVSTVFDAFRQEEYFSHLEELSEAEMALNAYELQLVISEDNIYSREVSLQDLHAMHQGCGLPGHLKLTLQSIVPRFITRYNHLRDQITRLVLGEESGETRQREGPAADEGEGNEPEVHTVPDEVQEGLGQDNQAEEQEAAGEIEAVEIAEHPQEHVTEESSSNSNELAEQPVPETEDVEQNATDAVDKGAEDDVNEASEHDEDASGETDEATYDLDADEVHAQADEEGTEQSPDEHDTEYSHEAEPYEEGYGDDFQGDGEGTDTAGDAAEPTTFSEDNKSEAHAGDEKPEPGLEPDDVQPGRISVSHSTSTSSFDADESSWEDGEGENVDFKDTEEETNRSILQTTAAVFDEEGNLTDDAGQAADEDGDDFGDEDFGDEDFEESAEGTLEDPDEKPEGLGQNNETSEGVEKDADAASREVLAESENFVSNLENEIGVTDTKEKTVSSETVKTGGRDPPTATSAPPESDLALKNMSKRSLDDAELDGEEEISSASSSPDSKRTRTL